MSRLAVIARETGFFALFLALSVAMTWPLALDLGTAVPDQGDPLLNAWILDWVCYALTHAPFQLYDAPMYYPGKYPLAYSENLLGIAIVILPFHLAGLAPVVVYNIAALLGFAMSAYGAFVLARMVSGSSFAAVVAGIFYAFVQFKWDHLSHLQIIWSGWLPLLLAAVIAYWNRPSRRNALLVFGAFVMNGLTNIHWLLFGSFAVAVTLALFAVLYPRRDRAFWQPIVVAIVAGSLCLIPVLLPYAVVSREYRMERSIEEIAAGSAHWEDWLRTTSRAKFYWQFQDPTRSFGERVLFPGLLVIFLSLVTVFLTPRAGLGAQGSGLGSPEPRPPSPRLLRAIDISLVVLGVLAWITMVTDRYTFSWRGVQILSVSRSSIAVTLFVLLLFTRFSIRFPMAFGGADGKSLRGILAGSRFSPALWASAIWIGLGMLGTFGTHAFLTPFLYRVVVPFRSVRAVGRWGILVYVGLVAWAAVGAAILLSRRQGWRKTLTAALIAIIAVVEVVPRIRWDYAVTTVPPVYRWLAREKVGPFVALPLATNWGIHFHYLLYQTHHRVVTLNGTSGFETPMHYRLRWKIDNGEVDDEVWTTIEKTGCKLLIVHADFLQYMSKPVLAGLQSEIRRGRLAFLRRFDRGLAGDYVFAFTSNLPDWPRLRDVAPDAIGNVPDENLRRLFEGQPVYSDAIVGRLEVPAQDQEYEGRLHMSGWAVSPHGIRSVTFILNGRTRIPAQEFARPDVHGLLPWYPKTINPGFVMEFEKRPKGIPKQTTVQPEIVDNAGRVLRLRTVHFTWH